MKTLTIESAELWNPANNRLVRGFSIRVIANGKFSSHSQYSDSLEDAVAYALEETKRCGWEIDAADIIWDENGDGLVMLGDVKYADLASSLPYCGEDSEGDDGRFSSFEKEKTEFEEGLEVAKEFGDLVATAAFLEGHRAKKS